MFKSLSTSLIARGILAVAVGVIALAWPSVTVLTLACWQRGAWPGPGRPHPASNGAHRVAPARRCGPVSYQV
jgi:hypothetical protein